MDERAVDGVAARPIDERPNLVEPERRQHRLSLEHIEAATRIVAPEFLQSPQYECEPLSEALGCTLTIKLDFTNPIRSFKGRGASFLVHALLRRGERRPLVCASAGNWGQAMAYVCRSHGLPLVVYAARNANPVKLARMQALGAEVRLAGEDFDAAKDAAKACAAAIGGWMVEDGREPEISEGHGTIAVELLAAGTALDAVIVPLGNGALLAGIARWMKAASPATQVIGVCAQGAPAMEQSWRRDTLCTTSSATTAADGIAVRVPIQEALDDLRGLIDDVLLVTEDQIAAALVLACRHAGLLLEPAGVAGLAGLLAQRERFAGRRVAVVLCGSNCTPELARQITAAC